MRERDRERGRERKRERELVPIQQSGVTGLPCCCTAGPEHTHRHTHTHTHTHTHSHTHTHKHTHPPPDQEACRHSCQRKKPSCLRHTPLPLLLLSSPLLSSLKNKHRAHDRCQNAPPSALPSVTIPLSLWLSF